MGENDRLARGRVSGIVVAVVASVLAALPSGGVTAANRAVVVAPQDDRGDTTALLRAELQHGTAGSARFATREATGAVTFIGGSKDRPLQRSSDDDMSTIGRRFVERYGPLFGVDDRSKLGEVRTFTGRSGTGGAVRFQQYFEGVPVIAGQVAVQIDSTGAVVSASGETATGLDIATNSTVPVEVATASAIALTAKYDSVGVDQLAADQGQLAIFDPALLGVTEDARGPRLVWQLDVHTAHGDIDRFVLVDARTGEIAFHFNQREDDLHRTVCDRQGVAFAALTDLVCTSPARSEGQPAVADADVNTAYDLAGVTYDFYRDSFGRDSLDGKGLPLVSMVNVCLSSCPVYNNAFWSSDLQQMFYGTGYLTDDVVGHEMTHGLTHFTSDLFFYADSGAINESISDVMGEFIDLAHPGVGPDNDWLHREDLALGANRSLADPPAFGDPDRMTSALFHGLPTDNHGVHHNSGVNNKAAFLITVGQTFNGQTVVGLGPEKAGAIYYQAQTTMLTPGSDYLDLFHILPQACTNLVGAAPLSITAADCEQVTKAVLATEMNQRAVEPGATLTAPLCPVDVVQNGIAFLDDMETDDGNWVSSATGNGAPWALTDDSSQSGSRSMHVADNASPRGISTLTGQVPTTIPVGTSFLRFDHSFHTDGNSSGTLFDGGVVEYSTTNGASWTDISGLPTVNGYVETIAPDSFSGLTNELAGRPAFGIISPNYQTTRVDFSTLAGQSVRLRFRFATDNAPLLEYPGWFIDDVSVYTCGPPQAPGSPRKVAAAAGNRSAIVTWLPPFSDGALPITGYTITPYIAGVAQPSLQSAGTATTFTATSLSSGTSYTFTVAAVNSAGTGAASAPSAAVTPSSPYVPLVPARLLDTRDGSFSVDGGFSGIGVRSGGTVTRLPVLGRGGVAGDAEAVVLNVTVTDTRAAGFVTVYPCGEDPSTVPPLASNLNHGIGSTNPNMVVSKVGAGGQICLFAQSATHLIVDVAGYFPPGSGLISLSPARLLDSRAGGLTVDGQGSAIGVRPLGSVTEVLVAGRAGVPTDATAAILNVTATGPSAPGYVTVYACGAPRPHASNLNYVADQTIPNAVVSAIGTGGKVCIFAQSATDLVVDVNGFFSASSPLAPVAPARLLDTRPDGPHRAAASVTVVPVTGRAGVPDGATAVVLNVTVTESVAPGYATVYPCGGDPPRASHVNYGTGSTVAAAVIAKVGADGQGAGSVCIYTQQAVHLVVDVVGYFAG